MAWVPRGGPLAAVQCGRWRLLCGTTAEAGAQRPRPQASLHPTRAWAVPARPASSGRGKGFISELVTFAGHDGNVLSGRLDRPTGAAMGSLPWCIFAHCFTCSKDVFAVSNISRHLAQQGYGVLRFDFTGLGQSAGDFAATTFSSNVADIGRAEAFLQSRGVQAQLLVGHSLGGSAVLAAAGGMAGVRAVATVGAVGELGTMLATIGDDNVEQIKATGEASVRLANRDFQPRRPLVDELESTSLLEHVAGLDRPLLLLHSPQDETVSIRQAGVLYAAAKHPKSFISLDGADHLLLHKPDAAFVANTIATWARRYTDPAPGAAAGGAPDRDSARATGVHVTETRANAFQQEVIADGHVLLADEPLAVKGAGDTGPSPMALLQSALGACTGMTIRMYAERKKYPLEHVSVDVAMETVTDSTSGPRPVRVPKFTRRVCLRGPALTAEMCDDLLRVANKCPVHKAMSHNIIETSLF